MTQHHLLALAALALTACALEAEPERTVVDEDGMALSSCQQEPCPGAHAPPPAVCGAPQGVVCSPGEQCIDGACVPPIQPGQIPGCLGSRILCDGRCVDPSSDADHCGACGDACAAEEMCDAGACVPVCHGFTCGGRCIDIMSDPENCGDCGYSCGPEAVCLQGHCYAQDGQACESLCLGIYCCEAGESCGANGCMAN
jgi:hypothetical protein